MELRKSHFYSHSVEASGIGAGVLPYAVDDDGKVRFLLGRERFCMSWKGSCRWSGFEGSRHEEETLLQTAVREFDEESMGVVMSPAELTERIRKGDYHSRIVLRILSDKDVQRYHATYLVRVAWRPDLPRDFQRLRASLEHIDRLAQEWCHAREGSLIDDGLFVGPVDTCVDQVTTVARDVSSTPCIVHPPWSVDHETLRVSARVTDATEAERLQHWEHLRRRIERSTALANHHPSVQVTRDAQFNEIQAVNVQKDFLEKDQIRWWGIDEVTSVIYNKGTQGSERFRPYFLPVLQIALSELTSDETVARDFRPRTASRPTGPPARTPPTEHTPPRDCPADA